jgi:TPR repeat protein
VALLERGLSGDIQGPGDLAAAVRWLAEAAESGDKEAQFDLYRIYAKGRGSEVEKDEALSWKYLMMAADGGHLKSLFELYLIYAQGCRKTVGKDRALSLKYLRMAAEGGHEDAQEILRSMIE